MKPTGLVFTAGERPRVSFWGAVGRRRWVAGFLLAVAVGARGAALGLVVALHSDTARSRDATVRVLAAIPPAPSRPAAPEPTARQLRDWDTAARHLATPWPALLDAMEGNTPDDVALVAIDPDPARGTVRVQVEARTLDALLAHAAALQSSAVFDGAVLHRHETNEQDAHRPMRLAFDARLRAATP